MIIKTKDDRFLKIIIPDHDLHKERLFIVEDGVPSPPPKPPGVPGMTGWGIIASVAAVAGLMLIVVRRRGREMPE